jgi:adenosylhomocysteinase
VLISLSKIANPALAAEGERNFEWAKNHMRGLTTLTEKHARRKPLEDVKMGLCLHVTKETAVLIDSLLRAGAEVSLAGANPLSTQDDIAAYLATRANIWAWRGESTKEYQWCIGQVLETKPRQVIDDGADLHVAAILSGMRNIVGGSEETTTGVVRLKAMEKEGKLRYPIIAVNNAQTKFLFDNRYGTGQSTIDGLLRATALLLAGKRVVVVGYGWVGRGIATRAKGMGANVVVVEVDPIRAIEAHLDGFRVTNITDAARYGEIFITATGQKNVLPYTAIEKMNDGAILSNAGHFDVEIDVKTLMNRAKSTKEVRPHVEEIVLSNGNKVYLIGKGRITNLVAAEGHPPEVMQMSFANQFMAAIHIKENYRDMENKIYDVPHDIELEIAYAALDSLGVVIDKPTSEQLRYAETWGT